MKVKKEYSFSASHQLLDFPEGHQCKRLHGHNYKVVIECDGPVNELGVVIDFGDISKVVKPLIKQLDHNHLNEVIAQRNPTAELLCQWIAERMELPLLSAVEVWETETCCARLEV